jgi:tRNA (guanine-N7-)-methyltransferase
LNFENRLPIHHPEYKYPASKNPYWTKLNEFRDSVFSDNETEAHPSTWRSRFPGTINSSQQELHVEIGCNAGHVIVEWAKTNPQHAYIGLDWKFKSIFRGAEKGLKKNLKNLIFFRAYAERIPYMFGPGEVDRLYLFFPDPWAKKSQWKNRFVTAERLLQIAKIMKPEGIFHIKTDHPGYFDWILDAVSQVSENWEVIEMTRDLHQNHPDPETLQIPEVTLFEKLFIKDGIRIQSLKLKVRNQGN